MKASDWAPNSIVNLSKGGLQGLQQMRLNGGGHKDKEKTQLLAALIQPPP